MARCKICQRSISWSERDYLGRCPACASKEQQKPPKDKQIAQRNVYTPISIAEAINQEKFNKAAKEAQEEHEEWLKMNGEYYGAVAGVTFPNDDGSSRQKNLKALLLAEEIGEALYVSLEEYNFKGNPAIRVLVNDVCIGNIPRSDVAEIQGFIANISRSEVYIEQFESDENGIIYRADISLQYFK